MISLLMSGALVYGVVFASNGMPYSTHELVQSCAFIMALGVVLSQSAWILVALEYRRKRRKTYADNSWS
jgi:hypothetical protein